MSRLTLYRGLLKNLAQEIPPEARRLYLTAEQARDRLVALTGEDFGYDLDAWRAYLRSQGKLPRSPVDSEDS